MFCSSDNGGVLDGGTTDRGRRTDHSGDFHVDISAMGFFRRRLSYPTPLTAYDYNI